MSSITKTIYIAGCHDESIEAAVAHATAKATMSLAGVSAFSIEALGGLVDETGTPRFTVEVGVLFDVRDQVGHWA